MAQNFEQFGIRNKIMNNLCDNFPNTFMYVCRTSAVPDYLFDGVITGLEQMVKECGKNVSVINQNFSIVGKTMTHPDEYQQQAFYRMINGHVQVDALKIKGTMYAQLSSEQKKPSFNIMIVDNDLMDSTKQNNNFIYGLSSLAFGFIIMSSFKFNGANNHLIDQTRIRNVAAHELGHLYYLVDRSFNAWSNSENSYLQSHCKGESGPCVMEQVDCGNGTKTSKQLSSLLDKQKHLLCPDCVDEIAKRNKSDNLKREIDEPKKGTQELVEDLYK